jgi:glycosyltransferase involved in cell wall biosynthesis
MAPERARIGVLKDDATVNALYRATLPMQALASLGHDVRWDSKSTTSFNVAMLSTRDVVYVHRYCDAAVIRLSQQLRERGVAIWWDNDDDVTAAPERSRPGAMRISRTRRLEIDQGIKKMLKLADLVTTPSPSLANRYRDLGARNVIVVENYLPDDYAAGARANSNGRIVIGWTAGAEHVVDLEHLDLRATLQRLLDRYPEIDVISAGVSIGLDHRYEHVPIVQPGELGAHNARYDIGIAPLADIALNRARSNIKLKEYAAVGVPWVASNVGPYVGLSPKEGGVLVAGDEWFSSLAQVVEDRRRRRKLASSALKWGRKQTIGQNIGRWDAALTACSPTARMDRS